MPIIQHGAGGLYFLEAGLPAPPARPGSGQAQTSSSTPGRGVPWQDVLCCTTTARWPIS